MVHFLFLLTSLFPLSTVTTASMVTVVASSSSASQPVDLEETLKLIKGQSIEILAQLEKKTKLNNEQAVCRLSLPAIVSATFGSG